MTGARFLHISLSSKPFSFTCNQLFEPLWEIMAQFFDVVPTSTICGSIFEGSFKGIAIGSHVGPYLDGVVLQVTADPCTHAVAVSRNKTSGMSASWCEALSPAQAVYPFAAKASAYSLHISLVLG